MNESRQLQSFCFDTTHVAIWIPVAEDERRPALGGHGYWAKVWPAAIGLAGFIVEHSSLIAGKQVLELAAGLGLPGLAAAPQAQTVILSDYVPEAVSLMAASAAANGFMNVHCRQLDWNDLPQDLKADVLLLSDINYEPAAFDHLHAVLLRFLQRGTTIILSTPQRLMAKPFIASLLPFCITQEERLVELDTIKTFISLFVLKQE